MKLRPYQEKAILNVRDSFRRGHKRTILQLATGGGKTLLSSFIIRQALERGNRVLVFVPRRELAFQFSETLKRIGIHAGIIMANVERSISNVQIASFDTFESWIVRKGKMFAPQADLIIIDEAHVYLGKQIRIIEDYYPDAFVIGLTATPARDNGMGLGVFYKDMVLGVSIKELTEQGYLTPVRYFVPPSHLDLSTLKLNRDGDYQERQLDEVMSDEKLVGDIVANWSRIAGDRQTVVFCSGIHHSIAVRDRFRKFGIRAEHIDGKTETSERERILEGVKSGEVQVLTNVYVATYGLDIPSLSCAVMARPTKNLTLYLQMIGRIMRVFEGKKDAIVIDHAGVVKENGLAEDEQYWSLDVKEKIKDRKEREKREKKEKKDITCTNCNAVYKAERQCPNCGHEWELWGKELPYVEADLVEVNPKKDNREYSWEEKIEFMGGIRTFAREDKKSDRWVNRQYKDKFGVWPNDKRVKYAPACPMNEDVKRWIRHWRVKWRLWLEKKAKEEGKYENYR